MLGPDNTLYYLAHGPAVEIDGRGKVGSSVHLLTYDIDADELMDHGILMAPGDRRVFFAESIEMDAEGRLLSVAWVETIDAAQAARIQQARGGAAVERNQRSDLRDPAGPIYATGRVKSLRISSMAA